MSEVEKIEASAEWQAKKSENAAQAAQKHNERSMTNEEKARMLMGQVPNFLRTSIDQQEASVYVSVEDKLLIIGYAFIGLAELVVAHNSFSMEEVSKNCIDRAIHNLRKDGLLN